MRDWAKEPLGTLTSIEIGGTPARDVDGYWAHEHKDGHPWVAIADLGARIVFDTKEQITDLGVRNSNVKRVPAGALIMSFKLTIGRVGIAGRDLYTNEAIAAFLPLNSRIDGRLLYYILPGVASRAITDTAVKGVTLNKQKLRQLQIEFPEDLDEQRRIALILSTIDEAIDQTEALIAKTQQIKAGLMHDLFTRGVTPDGQLRPAREEAPRLYKESPLGWIPKEWDVVPVDELCGHVVDCPHSTPTYIDRGVPCIRTADMLPGELLLETAFRVSEATYRERIARLVPQPGDVIYSREGERLGIASPVEEVPVCLGQRVMLLRPSSETSAAFLLWAMNTPTFYRRVVSGLGATTSPHVNVGDIRRQLVCRPSRDEQDAIGQALTMMQGTLRTKTAEHRKLEAVKAGLMHDLLTGRVRVPVAESREVAI